MTGMFQVDKSEVVGLAIDWQTAHNLLAVYGHTSETLRRWYELQTRIAAFAERRGLTILEAPEVIEFEALLAMGQPVDDPFRRRRRRGRRGGRRNRGKKGGIHDCG